MNIFKIINGFDELAIPIYALLLFLLFKVAKFFFGCLGEIAQEARQEIDDMAKEKHFSAFSEKIEDTLFRFEKIREEVKDKESYCDDIFWSCFRILESNVTDINGYNREIFHRWKNSIESQLVPNARKDSDYVKEAFEKVRDAFEETLDAVMEHCAPELKVIYGERVKKNSISSKKKYAYWYSLAADDGYAEAQYRLGMCYREYRGVECRDYDKAFSLFTKAAMQGHHNAMINLGHCYYCGNGTRKNFQKAGDCYKRACELGSPFGGAYVDQVYRSGKWDKNKYNPDIFGNLNRQVYSFDKEFLDYVEANNVGFKEAVDNSNYQNALVCANNINEQMCNKLVEFYCPDYHDASLVDKIEQLRKKGAIDKTVENSMHRIRKLRNRVMHNPVGEAVSEEEVLKIRSEMEVLLDYINRLNKTVV